MKEQLDSLVNQFIACRITLKEATFIFMAAYIKTALEHTKGNVSRAAHVANVHRNTVHAIERRGRRLEN